jgi:phage terminase large subunit
MIVLPKTNKLYLSKKRYNVCKGGAGSGKSHGCIQVEIRKATENTERTLFVRKVAKSLRNSIFALIKDILVDEGFSKGKDYEYNQTEMSFEFKNGSRFILAGLDDVDKLKSIAGITRIVIEEADQTDFEDFTQLDLRLRGEMLLNPQITLLFNPVSQNHWLKRRFFDVEDKTEIEIIESSYKDNHFLDAKYIQILEDLINHDENKYRIYVLNEWGVEDPNKLFVRDFNYHKHVVEHLEFDKTADIYLTFDLNYDPTCLVIQDINGEIRILKEYHRKGMNITELLLTVQKEFPGFYVVNGDASGHHSRNLTDNSTSYEIIKDMLGLSWQSFNVPKANPTHKRSRILTNILFKLYNVKIHKDCVQLIQDLEAVEVDEFDNIDAYKKKNPLRSHWLDALRYYIFANHSDKIRDMNIF